MGFHISILSRVNRNPEAKGKIKTVTATRGLTIANLL